MEVDSRARSTVVEVAARTANRRVQASASLKACAPDAYYYVQYVRSTPHLRRCVRISILPCTDGARSNDAPVLPRPSRPRQHQLWLATQRRPRLCGEAPWSVRVSSSISAAPGTQHYLHKPARASSHLGRVTRRTTC
ncbi:hypothetical protein FA95DRAFT_347673 [Auriscalpium vulgare]|uniref:Uncharacterized protein n=1 Tax=Auriscalpium vulgare TaxID=40419 RepID=A0ACB8RIM9_9AGAM|nr:hypothetical protein FA95DRAFT_347673 [Auriscalpium vulgare]